MANVLQWLAARFTARRSCRQEPRRPRLMVEGLEQRKMLSAAPVVSAASAVAAGASSTGVTLQQYEARAARVAARLDNTEHHVAQDKVAVDADRHDLKIHSNRLATFETRLTQAEAQLAADQQSNPSQVPADQARIASLQKRVSDQQLDVNTLQDVLNQDHNLLKADKHEARHLELRLAALDAQIQQMGGP
jgi:chromosome segregation ATPase